jgi:UDP-glucose:(heptosyl)LPS alpha-1,3-glucosyltransferase
MASRTYKIAVVIPKYGLVGGGEKFAAELAERLVSNRDYEIHVFANKWLSHSDLITFHKIPIITIPKFLTTISFAYFANRKIARMNFDLIHTHERIFEADIFTIHSIPHNVWVKEVRKKSWMSLLDYGTSWVERRCYDQERCQSFLPVSSIAKERIIEEYEVDPKKMQVIAPGVEIDKFNKFDREICRQEVREGFRISESDTVILFVSMNFELKGLANLMSALARAKLQHSSSSLKLLVVGKGDYNKYRRLAEQLDIKEEVIFAGVWTDNIEKIYLACDIFSVLSKFDTFGIVVLEAMAASLPVIISDKMGAMDLVTSGANGFVVDYEDIPAVSSKIIFLLDRRKREEMARKAFSTAQENSWDKMAEKVLTIYKKLLN